MDETEVNPNQFCRICGSYKLNFYSSSLRDRIELHQALGNDASLHLLIRPCECRGEFAYCHKACLSVWLETTGHEYCDICGTKYNVTYIEKSIFDWIFDGKQVRNLLRIVSGAILVYYISFMGILITQDKQRKGILDITVASSSWIWIVVCSVTLMICSYESIVEFRSWKRSHRRVVVDGLKEPQLESHPQPKDVLKSSGFRPHMNLAKK